MSIIVSAEHSEKVERASCAWRGQQRGIMRSTTIWRSTSIADNELSSRSTILHERNVRLLSFSSLCDTKSFYRLVASCES